MGALIVGVNTAIVLGCCRLIDLRWRSRGARPVDGLDSRVVFAQGCPLDRRSGKPARFWWNELQSDLETSSRGLQCVRPAAVEPRWVARLTAQCSCCRTFFPLKPRFRTASVFVQACGEAVSDRVQRTVSNFPESRISREPFWSCPGLYRRIDSGLHSFVRTRWVFRPWGMPSGVASDRGGSTSYSNFSVSRFEDPPRGSSQGTLFRSREDRLERSQEVSAMNQQITKTATAQTFVIFSAADARPFAIASSARAFCMPLGKPLSEIHRSKSMETGCLSSVRESDAKPQIFASTGTGRIRHAAS